MTAPSPGILTRFIINLHYPNEDAYVEALADTMKTEYRAIVEAGFVLQIDAPDLGMGRHTMYRNRSVEEFLKLAAVHIEVLNAALRNVPADRVRMHVCWGNYEGPHHHDVPMDLLWPVISRAKVQGLLFEGANPRHAHEWSVFRDQQVPEDKVLIPGVIGSTSNYIEHPELVSERIRRYADLVGRERVIAGSDCGFSTFAGFGPVDPDIAYLKLRSLVDGAALASRALWRS
jgi:5-methyltetrahydropteroyltriglutamate--homocysteine methyltransferase